MLGGNLEPLEWTAAHHSDTILPQHLHPIGGLNICSTYELAFVQEKKKWFSISRIEKSWEENMCRNFTVYLIDLFPLGLCRANETKN